ncbi:DNA (cytosine-5-)-methyltransferase [Pseudanabaena phage Pan5]|nr:DNA (cytosine-5-)-methyltransferase [Pseudanabaena phage Pan5]
MRPTAKGYFSGAGGMEIGMMDAGVDFIQSLDLDKDATDCMEMNPEYFGHQVLRKDIKDITVLEQPKTDIIVGTYPCTKYSTIADIHGTRTGDDLFLHFFRHIAIERPEMYIVENVPGMKKFKVVMEAMTKLPDYYVQVFCPLDASLWLPQRRKRLILIGTRKPFFIQEPAQSKRVTMAEIIEAGAEVEMPEYVKSRINGKYRDKPIVVDPSDPKSIAPTCVAHYSKDLGTRLVNDGGRLRPFSIREYARLQGFPDSYKFPQSRAAYKLIGNAVAVPMGKWVGSQAMRYFN